MTHVPSPHTAMTQFRIRMSAAFSIASVVALVLVSGLLERVS